MAIVQSLADRCTAGTPPRAEFVVSPRKRLVGRLLGYFREILVHRVFNMCSS